MARRTPTRHLPLKEQMALAEAEVLKLKKEVREKKRAAIAKRDQKLGAYLRKEHPALADLLEKAMSSPDPIPPIGA